MTLDFGAAPEESRAPVEHVRRKRTSMPLWHVALSVSDVRQTQRWYEETLGLMFARGTSALAGPLFSWVLGLRGASATCWWLNDRQDLFQLELFEFRRPFARPAPADWRPCDIGYSGISFHVEDLDAALERAERQGSPRLSPPLGEQGTRRVCVRDPDGVLIELMEEDPREHVKRSRPRRDVPAVARSVTLSVADLERSHRLFVNGLGLTEASGIDLHRPEHEALWGLAGAVRSSILLWAGDFLIELVSYREPAPAPREASYRISDRGAFHICFGSLDSAQFRRVLKQCRDAGCHSNSPAMQLGATAGAYVVDDQDFTIELLYRHRLFRQSSEATPREVPKRAPPRATAPVEIRRRNRFDSAIVIGADTPIGAALCRLLAEDDTSLWLLDHSEQAMAPIASAAARARTLLLAVAPVHEDLPCNSPSPDSLGPVRSVIARLDAGSVSHATLLAGHGARRELSAVAKQLAGIGCPCTLATLARPKLSLTSGRYLTSVLGLTAREAAETIYLATLRGDRTIRPRPSVWPPRRGASERPTPQDALLLPARTRSSA